MQAQDKLAFLLSLVPFLMEHDRISVQETAEHFGVKPKAEFDEFRGMNPFKGKSVMKPAMKPMKRGKR